MPSIAVIMPVRNCEQYVRQAIDSILSQTKKDFVFYILDDCSTDSTWDIVKEYKNKDSRIYCSRNYKQMGLTKSLNDSIGYCNYLWSNIKYFARQDGDDYSAPQRFEKQFAFMEANKDIGLVGSNIYIKNEVKNYTNISNRLKTDNEIRNGFFWSQELAHGTYFFRKEVLMSSGLYDGNFPLNQDQELMIRILNISKVALIIDALYTYREHKENTTQEKYAEQFRYVRLAFYKMWCDMCNIPYVEKDFFDLK